MQRRGILFVISAPSGGGKTTLVRALTDADPLLRVSVSHTTRDRRSDELDGVAYHFVDVATFEKMIAAAAFLEHARVFDHHYGTSKVWVEQQLAAGIDVVLEIDWQGARQIRALMPDTVGIYILPPAMEVLEQRLRGRGDPRSQIVRRMQDARAEISHCREYDYLVFNDDLQRAQADLQAIVGAARCDYRLQQTAADARIAELLR
ncbi:MAG: guanylate kinase [Gammaproteobacteria bacterium RIFCSPLOWO2_02_FULL_61_13]|nr:MAG: guanylate kinase [Gammaproteobacteria bacterium RIFCSPLOWO2_02_FULL_61_13]